MSNRELAVKYAWSMLGLPYHWGGDDPMRGFDCSGLVIEVFQAVGLLPHNSDFTANGLYIRYKDKMPTHNQEGCLCFWFNPAGLATHIEMLIDGGHTIGASGGGSSTTSTDAAADQNAFVKIRPLGYRGAGFKIRDPFL